MEHLVKTSNVENFYEVFYSVELLRKAADKSLAHYQQAKSWKSKEECTQPLLTADEMDALQYLGGCDLRNLSVKLTCKGADDALEILDCFKSEDVENQTLICLQNRGGLTGISSNVFKS